MAWFEILLKLIVGVFSEGGSPFGNPNVTANDDAGPEIDPDG